MQPNYQVNSNLCNKTNPSYLHELRTDNHEDKLAKEVCPENEKLQLEIRHQHCTNTFKPKKFKFLSHKRRNLLIRRRIVKILDKKSLVITIKKRGKKKRKKKEMTKVVNPSSHNAHLIKLNQKIVQP